MPEPRAPVPPKGGIHAYFKGFDRRVVATYLLGRDASAPAVPRAMARLLSSYERARAREAMLILLNDLPLFDGPPLWLARRLTFALARRPRGDDDATLDREVPPSGWGGNALALACWVAVLAGLWLIVAATGAI